MKHDDIQKHKSTNEFPWWKPINFKVGDEVEIIGGFSFMVGEICKVIAVSNDKLNLFPIRVASKIMEHAVFPESQLKLIKEANES